MQMDSLEADTDRSEMFISDVIKAGNMVVYMHAGSKQLCDYSQIFIQRLFLYAHWENDNFVFE